MKHLLNGVAIAAALAIVTPAWAQAPAAPASPPAPAAAAPAAKAPAPPAAKQAHHRPMRHMARRMHRRGPVSADNAMTEKLNQEELARIQGAPPPPPPPSMASPYKKGQ